MKGCGDIKMKGKKTYLLSCGCCDPITNKKDEILKKEHKKEVIEYKKYRNL